MWPFKKKQPEPIPRLNVKFTEDFKPFLFFLEHELTLSKNLHVFTAAHQELAKEDHIRKEIIAITHRVMKKISLEYKAVLRLYLSDEGILAYATEVIAAQLIKDGLALNIRHINGSANDIEATEE